MLDVHGWPWRWLKLRAPGSRGRHDVARLSRCTSVVATSSTVTRVEAHPARCARRSTRSRRRCGGPGRRGPGTCCRRRDRFRRRPAAVSGLAPHRRRAGPRHRRGTTGHGVPGRAGPCLARLCRRYRDDPWAAASSAADRRAGRAGQGHGGRRCSRRCPVTPGRVPGLTLRRPRLAVTINDVLPALVNRPGGQRGDGRSRSGGPVRSRVCGLPVADHLQGVLIESPTTRPRSPGRRVGPPPARRVGPDPGWL